MSGRSRRRWPNCRFLRDHHSGETIAIDVVLDFLAGVMDAVGMTKATILSAYRTRETNAMLAKTTFGVADNSQHIYGRALDIRLDSRNEEATQAARSMLRGGVGWYPRSGFSTSTAGRYATGRSTAAGSTGSCWSSAGSSRADIWRSRQRDSCSCRAPAISLRAAADVVAAGARQGRIRRRAALNRPGSRDNLPRLPNSLASQNSRPTGGATMPRGGKMRGKIIAAVLAGLWLAFSGPAGAAEPVATTDGQASGIRLAVQDLKVANGVATLRFTVTNESDKQLHYNTMVDPSGGEAGTVDGIYLVDAANKKKYLVVKDADKHCLCSRNLEHFPSKTSANLWAKFPAPPDSVQKVGVVVPHFIPMDDVPIAR
jgi:hypothetical protein